MKRNMQRKHNTNLQLDAIKSIHFESIEEELNHRDILGYCQECKEMVTSDDDHVIDNGKLYCTYCYKVKNNIHEELDFDR